jgi:hypothetical protein
LLAHFFTLAAIALIHGSTIFNQVILLTFVYVNADDATFHDQRE